MYNRKQFKYHNSRLLNPSARNTSMVNQYRMPPPECSSPIKTLKTVLQDPTRELLDIDPKDSTYYYRSVFSSIFTAALFIRARNWEQL